MMYRTSGLVALNTVRALGQSWRDWLSVIAAGTLLHLPVFYFGLQMSSSQDSASTFQMVQTSEPAAGPTIIDDLLGLFGDGIFLALKAVILAVLMVTWVRMFMMGNDETFADGAAAYFARVGRMIAKIFVFGAVITATTFVLSQSSLGLLGALSTQVFYLVAIVIVMPTVIAEAFDTKVSIADSIQIMRFHLLTLVGLFIALRFANSMIDSTYYFIVFGIMERPVDDYLGGELGMFAIAAIQGLQQTFFFTAFGSFVAMFLGYALDAEGEEPARV